MRSNLMFLLMLVEICSNTVIAKAQNCMLDRGNLCLNQCGKFTQDCYDMGEPYDGGGFQGTAIYPDCTSYCFGHGIGIDYCNQHGSCGEENSVKTAESIKLLRQVLPGAPVFVASCSGKLVQADLPKRVPPPISVATRMVKIRFAPPVDGGKQ